MKIDTRHGPAASVVEIEMESAQERSLTDEQWRVIANNQHRLCWINGHGAASLPSKILGRHPGSSITVKRDGDQVFVTFPLEP